MKPVYDKYYKEENYFKKPYRELLEFFSLQKARGKILDLGCGQGRDVIALAMMGYSVIGIDISSVGITQLNKKSIELGLSVTGEVADLYTYDIDDEIDIVLLDSILHFYKNDVLKETNLVKRVINELKAGGVFCNCMIAGKKRESLIKNIVENEKFNFQVLFDGYAKYPEMSAEYHMYIVKKRGTKDE